MPTERFLHFPPFCLDVDNACLWAGTQAIPLPPRDFAVLQALVARAGRLTTKKELHDTAWPGIYVSEAALMVSIRRLRQTLGDHARTPRFIETVHGWGYRFIAPVTTTAQPVPSSQFQVPRLQSAIVGREAELEQLHNWLEKALRGARQLVFVTGEPGIGKTTVVDAFLHQAASKERLWIARGQCIEHYSASDPALLVVAHYALGATLCVLGELAAAQEHLEQCIARYDPQQHHALALLYAEDPGIICPLTAAWVLWYRGYPDQALARAEETLILARTLAHPFNLGMALLGHAVLSQHCHRLGQVAQWTEEAVTLSTVQGFPFWLAGSLVLRGAMLAHRGQSEEGIEQMRHGLAALRATGAEQLRPYFLALLAEAYGAAGQAEKGLAVLAEALEVIDKTGERYYEAEVRRLKGELTLQSQTSHRQVQGKSRASRNKSKVDNPQSTFRNPQLEAEAEAYFHKAIEIACRQGAKSLELRAAMSLDRLWQQQGKKKQARKLLAEIYGWFTEGFDTADLQEAKILLEEL
ncbi:MAG: winged helix-turn-helix domain-containing protein [Candidatus Binatia bacterium]